MSETNKPNDGGPAFPFVVPDVRDPESGAGISQGCAYGGMTLRDWFAGQALMGLVADPNNMSPAEQNGISAYKFADAMLEARKK